MTVPAVPVDFTQTSEFKEAVAAAAQQAAQQAVEAVKLDLVSVMKPAEGTPVGLEAVFERLGLTLAEISDQGSSRRRVAPEILQTRAKARERMGEELIKAKSGGVRPEYRLLGQMFLNEQLIQPYTNGPDKQAVPTIVEWDGVPNEAMVPHNRVAAKIHKEFLASIGETNVPTADNRPLWITFGGVVVKGDGSRQRRQISNMPEGNEASGIDEYHDPYHADALAVKSQFDPRATDINVLGTVAEPAKRGSPTQMEARP